MGIGRPTVVAPEIPAEILNGLFRKSKLMVEIVRGSRNAIANFIAQIV